MSQLSRSQFPAGGWIFYQPQTGWSAPTPVASTFDQTVILIIQHRQANPAIVVAHNLSLDPATVANELEAFTRTRLGLDPIDVPKAKPRLPWRQAVVAAVAVAKEVIQGAFTPIVWLQEGYGAVSRQRATFRASRCARCPMNSMAPLKTFFVWTVARRIKRQLERRLELRLWTRYDGELGVCTACKCALKLKVHSPIVLIQRYTKPHIYSRLDANCWIPPQVAELAASNQRSQPICPSH